MNPLFSKSSLAILESLTFTKTLFAFDFDGTLSKIVRHPSDAFIANTTNRLFKELASLANVAIVSGRSLSDLRSRLDFVPKYMVGNHGLEGLSPPSTLDAAAETCRLWKTNLGSLDFGPGVEIEDKTYSLAIHYRRARQKKEARKYIQTSICTLRPEPRVIKGKSVVNLSPLGAPHKGHAVLELAQKTGATHIFYIGDDDTDEDVFSLPNSNLMTVRVRQKMTSAARYFVPRQSDIDQLLSILIRFHRGNEETPLGGSVV
jgi:trehalose 6-phosphate phosphatase